MKHSKNYPLFVMLLVVMSACSPASPTSIETPTAKPRVTATPVVFLERQSHIRIMDDQAVADYAYRSFLQIPVGMAWGPDGMLYIGDWTGHHVVRVTKDGEMDDLPFWRNISSLQRDGPRSIAFDSKGNLYFSNHNSIWRVESDGIAKKLTGVNAAPIGGIAISPDDVLYYTDRNGGIIKKWEDGNSTRVLQDLPNAENLVFGLDGTLYVTQLGYAQISTVDLERGIANPFVNVDNCYYDPCFLAVDPEGDIWVRSISGLNQFLPNGKEKPFVFDGDTSNLHNSAGIAFDDEGGLWIASYNSSLFRLAPVNIGEPDPEFTLQVVSPGFEASDLEVGSNGEIYASDENTARILRIHPDKSEDVLFNHGFRGRVGLAVDENNIVYAGMATGEIVRLGEDGQPTHYASLVTRRMTFGADGALYAVVGNYGENKSIVRITGVDEYTTLTTQIAGINLGSGDAHISPALDQGFYIYIEKSCDLLFMDYSGEGHIIRNLKDMGCGGPAVMAASPITGTIFVITHGPYVLYRITPDGQSTPIAKNVYGDPWGMVVSSDGQWLFVAESGAIDKIPLSKEIQ